MYAYCPWYFGQFDVHVAILRTCKSIYAEALPLLYSNVFRLSSQNFGRSLDAPTRCIEFFIRMIGPGVQFLRRIKIRVRYHALYPDGRRTDNLINGLKTIRDLTSARSVQFYIRTEDVLGGGYWAAKFNPSPIGRSHVRRLSLLLYLYRDRTASSTRQYKVDVDVLRSSVICHCIGIDATDAYQICKEGWALSLGFGTLQQLQLACGWITIAPFGILINALVVDKFGRVHMLLFSLISCVVALVGECITVSIFKNTGIKGNSWTRVLRTLFRTQKTESSSSQPGSPVAKLILPSSKRNLLRDRAKLDGS